MKNWISLICCLCLFASLQAQTLLQTIPNAHSERVNALAISDDGKKLFSAGDDQMLRAWDIETGERLANLKGNDDQIWNLALQGNHVVSAGRGSGIFVWNVARLQKEKKLIGHDYHVEDLDFCSKTDLLASASRDNTVQIWDLKNHQSILTLNGHESDVKTLAFSNDGTMLATFTGKRFLRIWDVNTQKLLYKVAISTDDWLEKLDFSPDGKYLIAAIDQKIIVWNTTDWTIKHRLRGHTSKVLDLCFLPDSKYFASCGGDLKAIFWDVETGKVQYSFVPNKDSEEILTFAFDKKGEKMATVDLQQNIKVWKTPLLMKE